MGQEQQTSYNGPTGTINGLEKKKTMGGTEMNNVPQGQGQLKKTNTLSTPSPNPSSGIQQPQTLPVQKKTYKYPIPLQKLRDVFRCYCIDNNYLNKERFNDAIAAIMNFPCFPEIHYTYLSEKLYDLLDDSKDGKIQEDEFIGGFRLLFSDQGFRMMVSVKVMAKSPNMQVVSLQLNEVQDYFYNSWIQGVRHLWWQINRQKQQYMSQGIEIPTLEQITAWAKKSENIIRGTIMQEFNQLNINTMGTINQGDIMRFLVEKDRNIHINFAGKTFNIATNMIGIDGIGIVD